MTSLLAATGANGQELVLPQVEYSAIFPQLLLIGAAFVLLVIASVMKDRLPTQFFAAYTAFAGFGALLATFFLYLEARGAEGARSVFAGALVRDQYAYFFIFLVAVSVIFAALIAENWLERHRVEGPEFYVLVMLSGAGAMFMAAANDLITVFLGLEILSIALYVLAGFHRRSERSREAAIKYFILGGFSSAMFLYGVALVYGAVGSTNLSTIATFLSNNTLVDTGLLLAGMALLFVGFAFKVGAVPFHQWTPDVYDGAPTPATAFMSAAAKVAAFAALMRVFMATFATLQLDWQPMVLGVAVITLLIGSIVACVQRNVKRMLAYSSISHTGYILLGLQSANSDGIAGALFYLFAYTFMVIGSFAIVMVVTGPGEGDQDLERYRGLGQTRPLLALSFTVLLIAQAGVPLTSGFLAKFGVISAQVENGSYITAVFAMVMAAVAAYFYLRLIVVMYGSQPFGGESENASPAVAPTDSTASVASPTQGEPSDGAEAGSVALSTRLADDADSAEALASGELQGIPVPVATGVVIAACVLVTLGLGIAPKDLFDGVGMAREAAADLFPRLGQVSP